MIPAYLQQYIDAIKLAYANEIIAIQDANFRHLYCSDKYIKLFNFGKELEGLRFQDINTDFFKNFTNLLSLATQASAKNIGSLRFFFNGSLDSKDEKEVNCYQVEGQPIIDPTTNEVIGRSVKIILFDVNFLNQLIYTINLFELETLNKRKLSGISRQKEINQLALTERESEVLFLLTLGKKYKNIATILSEVYNSEIQEGAINNIIHKQLFNKFDTYSIEILVQKALELGIIKVLPKSLQRPVNGMLNLQIVKSISKSILA